MTAVLALCGPGKSTPMFSAMSFDVQSPLQVDELSLQLG